jgi:hypothetical protein
MSWALIDIALYVDTQLIHFQLTFLSGIMGAHLSWLIVESGLGF